MIFTPTLHSATLIRRYKRFLADVTLSDGTEVTVHCPNTGSMRNCMIEGGQCWLSYNDNPKRKYAYTWQLSTTPLGDIACINTQVANKVVAEAIDNGAIAELSGYSQVKPEVKYGDASRIDFLLSGAGIDDCYVEVKSVTLLDIVEKEGPYLGYFPDAVSTRGQKHLRELMAVKSEGKRAVLLFCVLHTGIESVGAAAHIDPQYATLLNEAKEAGVEVLAYRADLSPDSITLAASVSVR